MSETVTTVVNQSLPETVASGDRRIELSRTPNSET